MTDETENMPVYHNRTYAGRNSSPTRTGIRTIIGWDNIVAESATGIFVVGSNNTIGERAQNITLLNSSGCIVVGGLVNVTVFNSSGVTVTDSNIKVENNINYPTTAGKEYVQTSGTIILLGTDPTMVFLTEPTLGAVAKVTLPNASYDSGVNQTNRKFIIKNVATVNYDLSAAAGQKIDNSEVAIGLATMKTRTVISNGSNWFIISSF